MDTSEAKNSIKLYALNSQHFVKQRTCRIKHNEEELSRLAQEVKEGVLDNGGNPIKRWRARFISILEEVMPSEPYSVCIGQAIKDNDDFKFIIEKLRDKGKVDKRIKELLSKI